MSSDFAVLAAQILPFARKCIVEDGGLYPVAAVISPGGDFEKVVPIEGSLPEGIDIQEIVNGLLRALANMVQARRVRAIGWCVDMTVFLPGSEEQSEALVLFREGASGASAVIVPYRKSESGGIEFSPAFEQATDPQVFTPA